MLTPSSRFLKKLKKKVEKKDKKKKKSLKMIIKPQKIQKIQLKSYSTTQSSASASHPTTQSVSAPPAPPATTSETPSDNIKTYHWKHDDNLTLLNIYDKHQDKMNGNPRYRKKDVWKLIHTELKESLKENGSVIFPSVSQVESRWKSMTSTYRKTIDHNNLSGNNRITFRYYDKLSEIYGYRPNVQPLAISSASGEGELIRKPNNPNNLESDDSVVPETQRPEPRKKRKYVSANEATASSLISWLEKYQEQKKKENEEKKQMMLKMHEDKMSLMRDILSSLKK